VGIILSIVGSVFFLLLLMTKGGKDNG
jgi:hypothetical protein